MNTTLRLSAALAILVTAAACATPNAQAVGLRPTRWDRVTADGCRLTVHYTATGLAACHTLGCVDVKETPRISTTVSGVPRPLARGTGVSP